MRLGLADDRAYTMIRAMHLLAVMRPWCALLESTSNILAIHGGRVWIALRSMAAGAGFAIKADVV
jgi:hypothetical protein